MPTTSPPAIQGHARGSPEGILGVAITGALKNRIALWAGGYSINHRTIREYRYNSDHYSRPSSPSELPSASFCIKTLSGLETKQVCECYSQPGHVPLLPANGATGLYPGPGVLELDRDFSGQVSVA